MHQLDQTLACLTLALAQAYLIIEYFQLTSGKESLICSTMQLKVPYNHYNIFHMTIFNYV